MDEDLEDAYSNMWESHLRQPNIWRYLAVAPSWLAAVALFIMMVMTFVMPRKNFQESADIAMWT